ncbi:MAG: hypothetical protein SFW09_18205 [Hyphomicrobiaceae bacterium]|nr:hypothetical protein [Hyphomicrobiaceae bacterium]
MVSDPVSEELRDFLNQHIDCIAQLEALLLMRADPAAEWSVAAMAGRLYATAERAAEALTHLESEGLIIAGGSGYRYAASSAHAPMVEQLAHAYTHHLIAVTNIVHDKPPRIHQFADAFKLRRRT